MEGNNRFIDEVARCCLDKFECLPKTGKPVKNEWTVLSCIVQYNPSDHSELRVVSLGTGSKCIGSTKMSPKGDILNDSHAEVMARRGFLVYLYENIDRAFKNESSLFLHVNGKCRLKESIAFAFYSSQLPCGDASIIPKGENHDFVGDIIKNTEDTAIDHETDKNHKDKHAGEHLERKLITNVETLKRNSGDDICESSPKVSKLETDIHRTGAKCLKNAPQDSHVPGSNYHLLGQVRTKPGRGDRTLSVSCSDKIARWIHVGIQGALIDILLEEPVYMKLFVFGNGVPYSRESLRRALLERREGICEPNLPEMYQSILCFPHIRSDILQRPAAGSMLWINTATPILEVAVLGKKLGVTKKKLHFPSSQLSISKYSLYKRFSDIVSANKVTYEITGGTENLPYNAMKAKSHRYLQNWNWTIENVFGVWTFKGDIWHFTV